MKKSELKQIIKEEINKVLTEIKINSPTPDPSPSLFDFIDGDDEESLNAYKELGFNIILDDPSNDMYAATLDNIGHDWVAVYGILEDCERMGLSPNMEWKGQYYSFEEAIKIADEKELKRITYNK
jgi:hypothetical protein